MAFEGKLNARGLPYVKSIKPDDKRFGNKFSNGAPKKFQNEKEFKKKVNKYFRDITKKVVEYDAVSGQAIGMHEEYMKPPTKAGLGLALSCASGDLDQAVRNSDNREIQSIYKMALERILEFSSEQMFRTTGSTAGIQFYMKNVFKDQFQDKQIVENSSNKNDTQLDMTKLTPEQLTQMRELMALAAPVEEDYE